MDCWSLNKEDFYITKRKLKAFGDSLCFYACRVFPIRKNRIAVCSFEGRSGFNDNPKYIVMELHKRRPDLEIIWLVNETGKAFPDYVKEKKNTLWNRAYYLTTSKVWIDNYRKPYGTRKRKGQFYLNTWHGMIGFKTIGLWRGKAFSKMAYLVSKNDSDMVDYFLSDSLFCTEYFPKGLVYDGPFLEVGTPRCDILLQNREDQKQAFRRKYNLPESCKCIMYAPTFREKSDAGKRSTYLENYSLDFDQLLNNLASKFGGEWYVCLRFHPQLASVAGNLPNDGINNRVVNVTQEEDMYELMVAMDALITDYSSCAMDAELMHIPIFVYVDDLKEYRNSRGDFVWSITESCRGYAPINETIFQNVRATLPFSVAHNNEELSEDIHSFDGAEYEKLLNKYEKEVGLIRDGKASERCVELIFQKIKE